MLRLIMAALLLALAAPAVAAEPEPGFDLAPARALFDERKFQEAADGFGVVAANFAARYPQSDSQRYYCARGGPDVQLYGMLGRRDKLSTTVLGPDWCEALFLQAYSYNELKNYELALAPLQRAFDLAPYNAQYANELGFVLRTLGRLDEAMEAYRTALDVADVGNQSVRRKAVALRGIGWILAERRQWDGAEKAYRDSLEIEPDNELALSELQYIEQNRARD